MRSGAGETLRQIKDLLGVKKNAAGEIYSNTKALLDRKVVAKVIDLLNGQVDVHNADVDRFNMQYVRRDKVATIKEEEPQDDVKTKSLEVKNNLTKIRDDAKASQEEIKRGVELKWNAFIIGVMDKVKNDAEKKKNFINRFLEAGDLPSLDGEDLEKSLEKLSKIAQRLVIGDDGIVGDKYGLIKTFATLKALYREFSDLSKTIRQAEKQLREEKCGDIRLAQRKIKVNARTVEAMARELNAEAKKPAEDEELETEDEPTDGSEDGKGSDGCRPRVGCRGDE